VTVRPDFFSAREDLICQGFQLHLRGSHSPERRDAYATLRRP
jgi:hypothetical protein